MTDHILYSTFCIVTYMMVFGQLKKTWPQASVFVHTFLAVVLAVLLLVNAAAFLICVGLKLDSVGK